MKHNSNSLNQIYDYHYEHAPDLYPEFQFKPAGNGWMATAGEIDGDSASGHLYFYDNHRYCLVNHKTAKTVWLGEYVKNRDGLANNGEALRALARMANIQLSADDGDYLKKCEAWQKKVSLLEEASTFCRGQLWSGTGKDTLDYLHGQRCYTDEDIRAMELGHNPGYPAVKDHLAGKGFDLSEIEGHLKWWGYRDDYRVVIPQKSPSGETVALWGRLIQSASKDGAKVRKYLPFTAAEGSKAIPFNIENARGFETVIGVEGIFDAKFPTARGLRNIVAWEQTTPSREQLESLKSNGVKTLIFVPDSDDPGREGVERGVRLAKSLGLNVEVLQLPIAKDVDEFVALEGVDGFRRLLQGRISAGRWMARKLLRENDPDTDAGQRKLFSAAMEWAAQEDDLLDRKHFMDELRVALDLPESEFAEIISERRREAQTEETKRKVVAECQLLLERAREGKLEEVAELAGGIPSGIIAVSGIEPMPLDVNGVIDEILNLPEQRVTGYRTLDRYAPIRVPSLIVIGARTSHGKTTFALNLVRKMLGQESNGSMPQVFFSLEVPRYRFLCQMVGAELGTGWFEVAKEIRMGTMSAPVSEVLSRYRRYGDQKRLYVFDDRSLSVDDVCAASSEIHRRHGEIGAVVVDYLGLLANKEPGENVEQKYSKIISRLATLSHDLVAPVIVISQMNREVDKNRKKAEARIPRADQLRYSGQIEQDADVIWGLFNVTFDSMHDMAGIDNPDEGGGGNDVGPSPVAQVMLVSLKDRYGGGFKPINFRMEEGTRMEEWAEPGNSRWATGETQEQPMREEGGEESAWIGISPGGPQEELVDKLDFEMEGKTPNRSMCGLGQSVGGFLPGLSERIDADTQEGCRKQW